MEPFSFTQKDTTMYYALYDLRKDVDPSSLSNIHLPTAACAGPVLIRILPEDYESVSDAVRKMCVNEGDEWMTTLVIRPENAPSNSSDLEANGIYVLIAHLQLFVTAPENFMQKLKSMKRLVLH